ncbi:MAG: ABC transporter substrate-binding protein [Devosia sp.]|nr:ABC transporter substrate-binding protein [Devosia sp.]
MHRTALHALAFGFALAVSITGAAAQNQPADMLELKLATADIDINPTTDSVLKLAGRLGMFEKHGVNVTIVALEGTPQAVAALNSGAVDLADISIEAAIRLRADNDMPIRGIVSGTLGAPFLIAAKSEIATVADLVGRTYAIADNGSLDHSLTQVVLASKGIAADGPSYVPIGAPAARVQALAAGKVDATTVSYGTFLAVADAPGISVLVSPEDFSAASPGLSKFVATLDSTIANKTEALQRFVTALVEASRYFEANPTQWVDAVAAVRDDLPRATLDKTADFLAGRWCVNGCLNPGELAKTVAFTYSNPDFKDVKVVTADDIVNRAFVSAALEALGAAESGLDKP